MGIVYTRDRRIGVADPGSARHGPHQRFLRLITAGQLEPIELTTHDWNRCEELCATYADLNLDLIDASLIAIAERLNETQIATLNHRDFTVVRPNHTDAFDLLPGPT